MDVIGYLSKKLEMKEQEIQSAKDHRQDYRLILIPKKNGSPRSIHAPHESLKLFQRKFLRAFLYNYSLAGQEGVIFGFRPGHSCVSNARYHVRGGANFVLKLDLKDAFPSVTERHLRELFRKVSAVHFRSAESLEEFVDFVVPLLTWNGVLPQGAPTSPYLLNLVLCHSRLIAKMREFLKGKGVTKLTVYADDFAISSNDPISDEVRDELIALVERESDFRINRKKIFYFKRASVAPLVTGLRLVEFTRPNGIKVTSVHLPKQTIRMIRGLIHRVAYEESEELRMSLVNVVEGHISRLLDIYGKNLPKQIAVPYKKYREMLEG